MKNSGYFDFTIKPIWPLLPSLTPLTFLQTNILAFEPNLNQYKMPIVSNNSKKSINQPSQHLISQDRRPLHVSEVNNIIVSFHLYSIRIFSGANY